MDKLELAGITCSQRIVTKVQVQRPSAQRRRVVGIPAPGWCRPFVADSSHSHGVGRFPVVGLRADQLYDRPDFATHRHLVAVVSNVFVDALDQSNARSDAPAHGRKCLAVSGRLPR
jgi:hypothetical protein